MLPVPMLDTDSATTYLTEPPGQGGSLQAKKLWRVEAERKIWQIWGIFYARLLIEFALQYETQKPEVLSYFRE